MAVDLSTGKRSLVRVFAFALLCNSQVGAGLRRLISRGELGSRRLVMLIFAGCSGLATGLIRHSFNSPQPLSNSLGDACFDLDFASSLNANETSWVGYRDLPPQSRSCCSLVCAWCAKCVSSLFVSAVPLELTFQTDGEGATVAILGAQ